MVWGPVYKASLRWDFDPPNGVKAVLLTILYGIVIGATAGVIIGYGQLYPILVDSGVYSHLCPGTSTQLST
jgi:ribose/xylose/arabinose/galactoside ABC-type transport system permease subunit